MQCNANMLPATVALDLVLIFALLTYTKKEKVQKNYTSTDLNPTINTNPNPQSTKLQNEKELNKARFMTLCKTAPYRNSLTYLYTGWSKKSGHPKNSMGSAFLGHRVYTNLRLVRRHGFPLCWRETLICVTADSNEILISTI